MEKLTSKEEQQIQLNILEYIDKTCRENDIDYSLAAGTLLGAIRHKGFIPWDDDVDIKLTRKNYDKLIKILKEKDEYYLLTPDNSDYYYTYSKLIDKNTYLKQDINYHDIPDNLGVFVDIFPLDNVPDDKQERKKFLNNIWLYTENMRNAIPGHYYASSSELKSLIKKVLLAHKFNKYHDPHAWKNILLKDIVKYNDRTTKKSGFLVSEYKENEVMDSNIFKEYTEVEFENKKFKAFKDYDKYLTNMYGEYMKLPPKDKQVAKHPYTAFKKG